MALPAPHRVAAWLALLDAGQVAIVVWRAVRGSVTMIQLGCRDLVPLLVLLGTINGASASQAASYKFIVLDPPGFGNGRADAINDAGQVFVDSVDLTNGVCSPFLWKGGMFRALDHNGSCAEDLVASSVSPWGLVIGTVVDNAWGRSSPQGFTFSTIQDKYYPLTIWRPDHSAMPNSIDGSGRIAGTMYTQGTHSELHCPCYAFVYANTGVVFLRPPGVNNESASQINDAGTIVGEALTALDPQNGLSATASYCFSYTSQRYTDLNLPGWITCNPTSLNASGDIAGNITLRSGEADGFTLAQGQYKYVRYPGASATYVTRLNTRGEAVGSYGPSNDYHEHAYRLFAGRYTNADPPGSVDTHVAGLNESGSFVGVFYRTDNEISNRIGHAFIAVCDPPGSRCWE